MPLKGGPVITFVLLAALSFPSAQNNENPNVSSPSTPEQVLVLQLEGLTQEEIQEEVRQRD
jgi:hypothetical protein